MAQTHWRKVDFRIESLKITISGLEKSILELQTRLARFDWHDGFWLLEETEPIYGLAFIAIQNYISSSIFDRFENLEKQHLKYRLGRKIANNKRTDIELITSIANYFKHRDYPKDLHEKTKEIVDFNLQFDKDVDIENSPIFKGLEILTENGDLNNLVKLAENWREKLWSIDNE